MSSPIRSRCLLRELRSHNWGQVLHVRNHHLLSLTNACRGISPCCPSWWYLDFGAWSSLFLLALNHVSLSGHHALNFTVLTPPYTLQTLTLSVVFLRKALCKHFILICSASGHSAFLTGLLQLEVLDTAGAEQFTSLNELYIKVVTIFLVATKINRP